MQRNVLKYQKSKYEDENEHYELCDNIRFDIIGFRVNDASLFIHLGH